MAQVADWLHGRLANPNLEAALLANFDRETGGTFDYATAEKGGGRGHGLPQYSGPTLRAYRAWLAANRRADSMDSQLDYFTGTYMPSRPGYRTYMAPGGSFTREQYADWLHKNVFTPAHAIPSNKAYSPAAIDKATRKHNDFMTNRLEAVNGVWRSVQPAAGPAAKQAEAVPLAARLIARLAAMKGAGRYLTVPNLRMRESDVEAAGRMFGGSARSADPSKYATWLNRILNRGNLTADVLVDKGTPLLHNPRFIIDRLSRTGWMASPDALRRAGVVQVNAAPVRSLDGGPLVATPAEMQAFRDGIFPFRSMYGRLAVAKDAAGKPIYVPWRISNHVNTATPVRVFSGQSGAGSYYDVVPGAASGVDPRLLTYKGSSRGSFDLFVPQGGETGIRFDWQEPYGAVGYYGGPRLGGPRDWGGVVYGSGPLGKRAEARFPNMQI